MLTSRTRYQNITTSSATLGQGKMYLVITWILSWHRAKLCEHDIFVNGLWDHVNSLGGRRHNLILSHVITFILALCYTITVETR